jgi:CelD/BcsL family acetyltransferase involved in cellulose biosynthesis
MAITFRVLTTIDDLRRVEPEWRKLESEDPQCPIMGTYAWMTLWWETFKDAHSNELGSEKELFILCAFIENELVAAAPFLKVKRRRSGFSITCIEFLGQQWGGLYQDILRRSEVTIGIESFIEYARRHTTYDIIFLKQIAMRSDRFERDRLIPYFACPEIRLDRYSNFDQFLSTCSKKLRGNLRQGISRMKRENLSFETRAEKVNEETIEAIKAVSRTKLADNKRWLWGDPLKERFYRGLFSSFDSFAAMISIDGKPAVYFANILHQSRAYCIDGAYDRSFPRFELGNLSVNQSIKAAFEAGLISLCMGPGLDEYKVRQANHLEFLCAYVERGNSFLGSVIGWLAAKAVHRRSKTFKESVQSVSLLKDPASKLQDKREEHESAI